MRYCWVLMMQKMDVLIGFEHLSRLVLVLAVGRIRKQKYFNSNSE